MAGIKELSDVVKFVCSLVSAVADAAEDGKATVGDVTHLMPVLYNLPSAVDGFDMALEEVKDLTEDELQDLSVLIKKHLELPDEKVEEAVEELVDICLKLYSVVKKLQEK